MPKLISPVDISLEEKECRKDYFDRHTPVIECPDTVREGEKFAVKVKVGQAYLHPDEADHHIGFIQLWNIETLVASVQIGHGFTGTVPGQVEIDFYLVARLSMKLTALSYCTKHGLWSSHPKSVKVLHENDPT